MGSLGLGVSYVVEYQKTSCQHLEIFESPCLFGSLVWKKESTWFQLTNYKAVQRKFPLGILSNVNNKRNKWKSEGQSQFTYKSSYKLITLVQNSIFFVNVRMIKKHCIYWYYFYLKCWIINQDFRHSLKLKQNTLMKETKVHNGIPLSLRKFQRKKNQEIENRQGLIHKEKESGVLSAEYGVNKWFQKMVRHVSRVHPVVFTSADPRRLLMYCFL